MTDKQRFTEAEKKSMTAMNDILNQVARNIFEASGEDFLGNVGLRQQGSTVRGLYDKDGRQVVIPLKQGWQHKHTALWYEGETGRRHAYTPWKDTKGRYWAFDYVPKGKGSRSGHPERWSVRSEVSFTTRKAAKARALKRYYKGIEK